MSSSNCCFLTCIQISQEAGRVVWYSHLFQNFPQFIVIHTVKGFSIVNKAKIDVFLELACFFHDPADIGKLISGSSAFSKISLNIRKFTVHVLLRLGLEEKGMANHFSILALRTPWTVWKGKGTRDQIANIRWIMEKAREFQKNIYFCFIDYANAFDCGSHQTGKFFKRWEY